MNLYIKKSGKRIITDSRRRVVSPYGTWVNSKVPNDAVLNKMTVAGWSGTIVYRRES